MILGVLSTYNIVVNIIVNFTPAGMIPTKDMSPHIPISVNEIVGDVHEVCEIG